MADLCETAHAYVVACELPGPKREDIDVRVGDRVLSVSRELKARQGMPGGAKRHAAYPTIL